MRPRRLLAPLTVACVLLSTAPALASVAHVVQPGETLWTIASANNLTTRTVAVFNGLTVDSQVVLGSTVQVPTSAEGYAALQGAGITPAAPPPAGVDTAASTSVASGSSTTATTVPAVETSAPAPTAATAAASSDAPTPLGSYTVRAGDSLSALASQAGISLASMAAMNGLDPDAPLLAGTVLKLPTGAETPARAAEPAPAATVVPKADPEPSQQTVDAATIAQIANEEGVSPSLVSAIGWQESGWNNNMVSGANARGVMQVMPGTWSWIQQNLTSRTLSSGSAADNVRAGALYVKHLLQEAGGDENTAIAAYYQGLGSVRSRGMYDDTKQYVANVQALRSRFGG